MGSLNNVNDGLTNLQNLVNEMAVLDPQEQEVPIVMGKATGI